MNARRRLTCLQLSKAAMVDWRRRARLSRPASEKVCSRFPNSNVVFRCVLSTWTRIYRKFIVNILELANQTNIVDRKLKAVTDAIPRRVPGQRPQQRVPTHHRAYVPKEAQRKRMSVTFSVAQARPLFCELDSRKPMRDQEHVKSKEAENGNSKRAAHDELNKKLRLERRVSVLQNVEQSEAQHSGTTERARDLRVKQK